MDPEDAFFRWDNWSIDGTPDQLAQVVASLDAKLPPGWRRATEAELGSLTRAGSAGYAMAGTPAHIGVTATIETVRGARLRGGRVWFEGPPYPTPTPGLPAAWGQVLRLLDEGVTPAAQRVGIAVRFATSAEVFLQSLPFEVRCGLRKFSEGTRKTLPLDRDEASLWHRFVVGAFRTRTPFDAHDLQRWLTSQGWSPADAAELALRLSDHSLLLTRYTEEASAV